MNRKKVLLKTLDGTCEAWEISPDNPNSAPAILMYMDAIGVREATLVLAENLAANGYFVLLPNLFYRDHELPLTTYPETFSKEELGQFFSTVKIYMANLTPQKLLEDARVYLEHLKDRGQVKIIGYCFGGGHGIRTAATYPEQVSHVVSLHGGQLAGDADHAPIKYLAKVKAALYFGHADHDSSMPLPMIQELEGELSKTHPHAISKIFKDAHHGFTMIDLPAYQREACEQSMKEAVKFFRT